MLRFLSPPPAGAHLLSFHSLLPVPSSSSRFASFRLHSRVYFIPRIHFGAHRPFVDRNISKIGSSFPPINSFCRYNSSRSSVVSFLIIKGGKGMWRDQREGLAENSRHRNVIKVCDKKIYIAQSLLYVPGPRSRSSTRLQEMRRTKQVGSVGNEERTIEKKATVW